MVESRRIAATCAASIAFVGKSSGARWVDLLFSPSLDDLLS
jgi:hypothetical protein